MDSDYISKAIEEATVEADKLGIKGKETTPYLLDRNSKDYRR